jgi:hypothetical protein
MKRDLPVNLLVLVAIIGHAIAFGLSICIARRPSISGFEAYVVAAALFILLATLSPLGAEKLTLRQWPALVHQGDWSLAHGLLRFGLRRTLTTALIAGGMVAVATTLRSSDDVRLAVLVTCLSMPAGALAHYGVDLLTAAGRPFRALAIFRVLVPASALTLFTAALALGVVPEGWLAVAACLCHCNSRLLFDAYQAGIRCSRHSISFIIVYGDFGVRKGTPSAARQLGASVSAIKKLNVSPDWPSGGRFESFHSSLDAH